MSEIDPVFLIALILCAIALGLGVTVYPLWIILHNILGPKLDRILFKEPYFRKSELANYVEWPLSFVKSLNYIYLIAAPGWAKRKRFKELKEPLPIGATLKIFCKIEFCLMLFGGVMCVVFFSYLGMAVYFFT